MSRGSLQARPVTIRDIIDMDYLGVVCVLSIHKAKMYALMKYKRCCLTVPLRHTLDSKEGCMHGVCM